MTSLKLGRTDGLLSQQRRIKSANF